MPAPEFIPTDEPAAGACCCCGPVEEAPAAIPAVEQVAPAADPVAPAADPVAPAAASVAPEPASIVAEPATPIGPTTTGVEGNLPEEFSGLSTQTSAAPVLTDYTPQEFIDIAREALVSPGPNAVDPNPKTRAMDAVFDGLLSDSRPVDRTVAP